MIYRLFIFLLILSACQRKTMPEPGIAVQVEIDTTVALIPGDELPGDALQDVNHLLGLGYQKANKEYDSISFEMYFDPALKDSIRIQTQGTDTVYMVIGNDRNKKVALYSYLDLLGYRFYGPEDHWTYIPELDRYDSLDTIVHSHFSLRRLAPSFNISRRNITSLSISKMNFSRWQDRLRMASLVHIPGGHYGSSFNVTYKEQIISNPEWRGKNNNGDPRSWKRGLKLCYNHPGVIKLYQQDALKRLSYLQKNSEPPYILNMEPPDGNGFCECTECESEVSDQVYGLAKKVAQVVYEKDTNAMVSLYGYNEHAPAPSFSLGENMIVGVVPYAFQGVGSPEKMMDEWEKTGARLYLRDYLAIPIWKLDQPVFNPQGDFISKIKHLQKKDYLGYSFETTTSFMSVGLQFYLLSKASWESTDASEEYRIFLRKMFPDFEEEVSLIYQNLPYLDKNTFADALNRLRQLKAIKRVNDYQQLLQRVKDLEFYVEYLYLLDRFQSVGSEKDKEELLDKILSEPGTRLLHSYGLYRVLKRKTKIDRPFELTMNQSLSGLEIKSALKLRRKRDQKYKALIPEFYMESVSTFAPIPLRNAQGIMYVGKGHGGTVIFKSKLKPANSSASGVVIIRDMEDNHVKDIKLTPDNQWYEHEFKLESENFYKIQFRTPGSELTLKGPNRPFAFTEVLLNRYLYNPTSFYFHVPDDQNDVQIQIPLKSNRVIVRSGERNLYVEDQSAPYIMNITDQEGQVIEIVMYRHGLELLNIPHMLALHKEGVIFQVQE